MVRKLETNVIVSPRTATAGAMMGIPDSITTTLHYSDTILFGSLAATYRNYVFRANDCYDPDLTGTGHQPMLFDQYMTLYNNFCVLSSTIKAQWCPQSNVATLLPCAATLSVQDTSTPSYSYVYGINELANTHKRQQCYMTMPSIPISQQTIYASYNGKKNLNKEFELDVANWGTAGASPTTVQYYVFTQMSPDFTINSSASAVKFDIVYKVRFFRPNTLGPS